MSCLHTSDTGSGDYFIIATRSRALSIVVSFELLFDVVLRVRLHKFMISERNTTLKIFK